MRIGQPVVQGGKTHLCAVAHQQKNKGCLEPCGLGKGSVFHKPAHLIHTIGSARGSFCPVKSHGKQNVAQQGKGNAHRTDNKILPRGLKRTLMPVKIDELGARKCGGLNAHPLRAHVRRNGNQRHGAEKKAQTGGKAALGRVGEAPVIQNIGVHANAFFFAQVVHGVKRCRQKKQTCQHEKKYAKGVGSQKAVQLGGVFALANAHGGQGRKGSVRQSR